MLFDSLESNNIKGVLWIYSFKYDFDLIYNHHFVKEQFIQSFWKYFCISISISISTIIKENIYFE